MLSVRILDAAMLSNTLRLRETEVKTNDPGRNPGVEMAPETEQVYVCGVLDNSISGWATPPRGPALGWGRAEHRGPVQ